MSVNANLSEQCMALSEKITALGRLINGRRAAQIIFSQLTEAATELGAGVKAIDCLTARSMRCSEAVELVKYSQKVIYILNLALRSGIFVNKQTSEALGMAVKVSEGVNGLLRLYDSHTAAPAVRQGENRIARPLSLQTAVPADNDPDGFNALYNGKF